MERSERRSVEERVVRIDSTDVVQYQGKEINSSGFFKFTRKALVSIDAHPKRQQGHLAGFLMASACLIGPRRVLDDPCNLIVFPCEGEYGENLYNKATRVVSQDRSGETTAKSLIGTRQSLETWARRKAMISWKVTIHRAQAC